MQKSALLPNWNPAIRAVRSEVLEVVVELVRLDHRLFEIAQSLPLPADVGGMWENELPYSEAAELHATIECVKSDALAEAITTLRAMVQTTEADLRRHFVQRLREQGGA
jgi:hypothetical protein